MIMNINHKNTLYLIKKDLRINLKCTVTIRWSDATLSKSKKI